MWRILLVVAVVVGCAETPEREDPGSDECPAWKIEVIENNRVICVDESVLERERELIEDEESW